MILLLFFSLLAALAGFVAGYGFGSKSILPDPSSPALPPTAPQPTPPTKVEPISDPPAESTLPEPPPTPSPVPAQPEPPVESDPTESQPQPEPSPIKVIAAPEAALKAFLSAPDWRSRAKHTLHGDRLLKKMEAYHTDTPDGPTKTLSLTVDASHDDPEKGTNLFTYRVGTETHPKGFPVAILQTPDGWKVDWETFVEFRDDHFRRFATGEGSDIGAFHLVVRNTHYFGAPFSGIDKLTAFRVDPPLLERDQYAFVPTGSELHKTLAAATEWGHPCPAVLQLARKKQPDGKTHLEITSILAPNWRPQQ
ncbi:hypothetical protein OKA05_27715 [Luteolibacter arcticus]|uniref:Uncharacterized protein n=1 Tax=Luteolibacter arcticus TaxID=1581411 RepID=A0ABT3GS99_9BACT|nr:hypothetical protein [Luteolibacter arcticus]MCW1926370.1 hypothetical protein [Luteolibacter arcticus]